MERIIVMDIDNLSLEDYKKERYAYVDYKTGWFIQQGFTYEGATFSLSPNAQRNWSEIHSNPSEFEDPITISTIDNNEYILIVANVNAFWIAGKDVLKGHLDSGRILKKRIFDAIDKDAVNLIIDER